MKNIVVANFQAKRGKLSFAELEKYIQCQIDNSLALNWKKEDIVVIANFEYVYQGIKTQYMPLNNFCLTGSKVFAIRDYLEGRERDGIFWTHDLDIWQDAEFSEPEMKDIGISTYSRPTLNGGSVFYRKSAIDILHKIVGIIQDQKRDREEPTINEVLKSDEYKDRVTILETGFNVGCSGFKVRWDGAIKPVKAFHFHPTNRIAWDTMARNRNGISKDATISKRLRELLVKYYGDVIKTYKYEDGKDPLEIREKEVDRSKDKKADPRQ